MLKYLDLERWSLKNLPAYDVIVQAMGGIMSITGHRKDNFTRVSSIGDITAGLYCAIGILAALNEENKTNLGKNRYNMLDCQVAILENAITRYSVSKKIPYPLGQIIQMPHRLELLRPRMLL